MIRKKSFSLLLGVILLAGIIVPSSTNFVTAQVPDVGPSGCVAFCDEPGGGSNDNGGRTLQNSSECWDANFVEDRLICFGKFYELNPQDPFAIEGIVIAYIELEEPRKAGGWAETGLNLRSDFITSSENLYIPEDLDYMCNAGNFSFCFDNLGPADQGPIEIPSNIQENNVNEFRDSTQCVAIQYQGQTKISGNGKSTTLHEGEQVTINPSDTLKTGPNDFVYVICPESAHDFSIGPYSEITLECASNPSNCNSNSTDDYLLSVIQGMIRVYDNIPNKIIKHLVGPGSLSTVDKIIICTVSAKDCSKMHSLRTQGQSVSIRGTEFVIDKTDSASFTYVYDGSVKLDSPNGQSMILDEGEVARYGFPESYGEDAGLIKLPQSMAENSLEIMNDEIPNLQWYAQRSVGSGGGCLIATATYGSELAPQVQLLREIRDNSLLQTESGTNFMNYFNDVYYSFSPYIADYERENPVFKEMIKITITPMISSLSILNYVDMDSEESVLGYGIGLIILNLAMYVGIPTVAIIGIRRI